MNRKLLKITALILTLVLALAICMTGCSKSKKLAGDLGTLKDDVAANKADATKALSEATKALEDKIKAQDTNCATEISAVEKALEAVKNDSDEADAEIKAALEAVRSALNAATTAIESKIEANNTDLSAQISSVSAALKAVEANGNATDSDIKAAQKALSDALDAVSTELATAKAELSNKITENAASASKEIANLNTAIIAASKNLEAAKKAIEETHNADIAALSSKLESTSKTLSDAISDNTKAIERLESELKALQTMIENKLASNKADTENEISSLSATLASLKTDLIQADNALQGEYLTKIKELSNTISGISDKLADYIAKNDAIIAGIKDDIDGINAKIDALDAAKEALDSKIDAKADDLSAEIKALGDALTAAEAAGENANDELKVELEAAIEAAIGSLKTSIDVTIKDIEEKIEENDNALSSRISSLAEAIKALRNDAALKTELEDVRAALQASIDATKADLEAAKTELNNKITANAGNISKNAEDIAKNAADITTANANITAAKDLITALEEKHDTELAELKANLEAADANLLSAINTNAAAIAQLREDLTALESKVADEIEFNNINIAGIKADIIELQDAVEAVRGEFADADTALKNELTADYTAKINALQTTVTEISTKLELHMAAYQAKIDEIEGKISDLTTDLSTKYDELNGKIDDEKQAVLDDLNAKIDELNDLIGEVEGEETLQAQITAAKAIIESIQDKMMNKDDWDEATSAGLEAYIKVSKLHSNVSHIYGDNFDEDTYDALEEALTTAMYKLMRAKNVEDVNAALDGFEDYIRGLIHDLNTTCNEIYGYIKKSNDYVANGNYDVARGSLLEAMSRYTANYGDSEVKYIDEETLEVVNLAKELANAKATYANRRYAAVGSAIEGLETRFENNKTDYDALDGIKADLDAQRDVIVQLIIDGFGSEYDLNGAKDAYNELNDEYNEWYVSYETEMLGAALSTYYGSAASILNDAIGAEIFSLDENATIADIREAYDAFIARGTYKSVRDELGENHGLIKALEEIFNGKLTVVEEDRETLKKLYDEADSVSLILAQLQTIYNENGGCYKGTQAEYDLMKKYEAALAQWQADYNAFLAKRDGVYEGEENEDTFFFLEEFTQADVFEMEKEDLDDALNPMIEAAKAAWDKMSVVLADGFNAESLCSAETMNAATEAIAELKALAADEDGVSFIFNEIKGYNEYNYDSFDEAEAAFNAVKAKYDAYVKTAEDTWAEVYTERVQGIIANEIGSSVYDKRAFVSALAWYNNYCGQIVPKAYAEANELKVGTAEIRTELQIFIDSIKDEVDTKNNKLSEINTAINNLYGDANSLSAELAQKFADIDADIAEWKNGLDLSNTTENIYLELETNLAETAYEARRDNYNMFVADAKADWSAVYTDKVSGLVNAPETVDIFDWEEIDKALAWFDNHGEIVAASDLAEGLNGYVGTSEIKKALEELVEDIKGLIDAKNKALDDIVEKIEGIMHGINDETTLNDIIDMKKAFEVIDAEIAAWKNGLPEGDGYVYGEIDCYLELPKDVNWTSYNDIKTEVEAYLLKAAADWKEVYTDSGVTDLLGEGAREPEMYDIIIVKAAREWFKTYGSVTKDDVTDYELGNVGDEEVEAELKELEERIQMNLIDPSNIDADEIKALIDALPAKITLADETNVKAARERYCAWAANIYFDVDNEALDIKIVDTAKLDAAEITITALKAELDSIKEELDASEAPHVGANASNPYFADEEAYEDYKAQVEALKAQIDAFKANNETTDGYLDEYIEQYNEMSFVLERYDATREIKQYYEYAVFVETDEVKLEALKQVYEKWILNVIPDVETGDGDALAERIESARNAIDGISDIMKDTEKKPTVNAGGDNFGNKFESGTHEISTGYIMNGTYNRGDNVSALFVTGSGTNVTIAGGLFAGGEGADNTSVTVTGGATVTINGGWFTVGGDYNNAGNSVIYADGDGTTVYIKGGVFKTNHTYNGKYWVLNCKNGSNAKIIVSGGRFYKFNPAKAAVKGSAYYMDDNNVSVAKGYHVIQDGDWFEVVPDINGTTYSSGDNTLNDTISMDGTYDVKDIVRAVYAYGAGTTLTITNGNYDGGSGAKGNVAVGATSGANITIAGGYFTVGGDNNNEGNSVIFADDDAVITITGGYFRTEVDYKGKYYVLNCRDGSTAKIIVKGGAYYKFNPAEASTEGSSYYVGTSEIYVADGYEAVQVDDWFFVVPTNQTYNGQNLTSGDTTLNDGDDVTMNGIYSKSDKVRAIYATGSSTTLTVNGGTYDGGSGAAGNVALKAANGAQVTIAGGYFTVGADAKGEGNAVIYADTDAVITITGGEFRTDHAYDGRYFVLNCKDGSDAKIIVKGGRYYKFNPALASVKDGGHYTGDGEISIAKGYHVEQDGDWYEVVADTVDGNGMSFESGDTTINTTVQMSSSYVEDDYIRALYASGSDTTLTIEGGYYDGGAGGSSNIALRTDSGATVTINGGYFTTGGDYEGGANSLIYATSGSTIYVKGGTFRTDYSWNGAYYVLNCKNSDPGKIIVSGGRFYKFNPALCSDPTSTYYVGDSSVVVAAGYHVVQDGDWFTVVADVDGGDNRYFGIAVESGETTLNTTIAMSDSYVEGDKVRAISADGEDVVLTITDGYYDGGAGGTGNVALGAINGAQVTIAGGYFTVGKDYQNKGNALIEANTGATITITGGTFRTDYAYEGKYYVLNCKDKSDAQIIVKGGRYYKFNPALASVEGSAYYVGEGEIVVAEGYDVVQDGDWFEVVAD